MVSPKTTLERVCQLIDRRKYFNLHGGHRTGKTTAAQWLVEHLNSKDKYFALFVDAHLAGRQPDVQISMHQIIIAIDQAAEINLPELRRPNFLEIENLLNSPEHALIDYLRKLTEASPRRLILFFDGADELEGPSMVSFLIQIRQGYISRTKAPFPHSIVLVGSRRVRDFSLTVREKRALSWLGTSSPFSSGAEAVALDLFSFDQVRDLFGQYKMITKQMISEEAVDQIFDLSKGHPWLVNALADQLTELYLGDRFLTITPDHVGIAKEALLEKCADRFDWLTESLHHSRIRNVILPMLTGEQTSEEVSRYDLSFVEDSGLIDIQHNRYQLRNPIFREVIPRILTQDRELQLPHEVEWYINSDGTLDLNGVLEDFQNYWRDEGHHHVKALDCENAGPILLLLAFLKRIVSTYGTVSPKFGLGRGATGIIVKWGKKTHALSVKVSKNKFTNKLAMRQLIRSLESIELDQGWLIIFDLRPHVPWDKKISSNTLTIKNKTIHLLSC